MNARNAHSQVFDMQPFKTNLVERHMNYWPKAHGIKKKVVDLKNNQILSIGNIAFADELI